MGILPLVISWLPSVSDPGPVDHYFKVAKHCVWSWGQLIDIGSKATMGGQNQFRKSQVQSMASALKKILRVLPCTMKSVVGVELK